MANLDHVDDEPKHVKISATASVFAQSSKNGLPTVPCGDPFTMPSWIPSFADASKLISGPYSCLVMDTHRRHIALSPMYLKKKRTGIQQELDTELLKYSESLQGVPLAYDNIRIVCQNGDILDDSGYIHMDVEASFVVFKPVRGQKLLGKVNKLGVSHAGCLVHGCFNASVPKPSHVSTETWRDAGPKIGTDLEFEVGQIDADIAGVLLIRGRLKRTSLLGTSTEAIPIKPIRVQELLAMAESSEARDWPLPMDTGTTPECVQELPDHTPKKKKKKKRDKLIKEEREDEAILTPTDQQGGDITQDLNGITENANGIGAGEKAKKKKKKDKLLKEEPHDVDCSPMEVHGSDSSGYLSDKPSKKRKLEAGVNVASCLNANPETPKSKKKRKSDI